MSRRGRAVDPDWIKMKFRCRFCKSWIGQVVAWNGDPQALYPDGQPRWDRVLIRAMDLDTYMGAMQASQSGKITFRCPRCQHAPQLARAKVWARIDELRQKIGPNSGGVVTYPL